MRNSVIRNSVMRNSAIRNSVSYELILIVLRLDLLGRRLHEVITHRTLHAVLIRVVVNHRMFTAEIIKRRRRSGAPLERRRLPRVIGRGLAPETAVNQVEEKNKLGRTGNESSDG